MNFLRPLSYLYGWIARIDRRRKLRQARSFSVPVVSVGGITAGGSGKTPVTRELLRHLQPEYEVILLSRGYGRKGKDPVVWEAGKPLSDPAIIGDEPALLARSITRGVVGVGPDRAALLEHILSTLYPGNLRSDNLLVLLDDGFQHARLQRDLDLVIVDDRTATERFLLPAGYLREEHTALARADLLLATSEKSDAHARQYAGRKGEPLQLHFRTEAARPWKTSNSTTILPTTERPFRVLLVTGIAHPERVRASAEEKGYHIAAHYRFRDHYRYTAKELQRILADAHDLAVDVVLTTEKDAVKLETWFDRYPELRTLLYVLPLEAEIAEISLVLARIGVIVEKKREERRRG